MVVEHPLIFGILGAAEQNLSEIWNDEPVAAGDATNGLGTKRYCARVTTLDLDRLSETVLSALRTIKSGYNSFYLISVVGVFKLHH